MPKEFNLYGKKIVISDEYNTFYEFHRLVVSESKKAISEFTRTCNSYGSIEKFLKNSKNDGDKILSSFFQNIISGIFAKLQIYDIDVRLFRNKFYRDSWSSVIERLADKYDNLSNQIDVWTEKEREDRGKAIGAAIGDIITGIPSGDGLDAESRANKALEKLKKLKNEREKLYNSKSELIDEFSASLNGIWESCCKVINEHGITISNSMNIENMEKAKAIVNNMEHMSQSEVIELLPDLVLSIPYSPNLCEKLLLRFGDAKKELAQVANFFGVS